MNVFTTEHPMAPKRTQFSLYSRAAILCVAVFFCLFSFYIGCFVWRFDIFSAPVRENAHGWMGPEIRGVSHTMDIGGVYYYEGTDFSLYQSYRPLCEAWLVIQGLSG
jgi:hypothetical protein